MVVPIVNARSEIVDRATQDSARVFERCRQTRSARWTQRVTIRAIKAEAWNQCVCVEVREPAPTLGIDERLVLLGLHSIEIFFRSGIDSARLRMVNAEIQAKAVPNLEWIASKDIET